MWDLPCLWVLVFAFFIAQYNHELVVGLDNPDAWASLLYSLTMGFWCCFEFHRRTATAPSAPRATDPYELVGLKIFSCHETL